MPGYFSALPFGIRFAPFGVVTGVVCAAVFLAFGGCCRFERVSLALAATCGAVSGLPAAAVVTALRGEAFELLALGPALALAGAACAAGLLAVARHPERTTAASRLTEA